jgi:hypothetical protein
MLPVDSRALKPSMHRMLREYKRNSRSLSAWGARGIAHTLSWKLLMSWHQKLGPSRPWLQAFPTPTIARPRGQCLQCKHGSPETMRDGKMKVTEAWALKATTVQKCRLAVPVFNRYPTRGVRASSLHFPNHAHVVDSHRGREGSGALWLAGPLAAHANIPAHQGGMGAGKTGHNPAGGMPPAAAAQAPTTPLLTAGQKTTCRRVQGSWHRHSWSTTG